METTQRRGAHLDGASDNEVVAPSPNPDLKKTKMKQGC